MPTKLYIGNLPFKIADAELNELFASLSIPVEKITLIRDAETGRSRGFAFAELAQNSDAERAIKELNGKVIEGRTLTVNEARPMKKREFGSGGGFNRNRGSYEGGGRDQRGEPGRNRPRRRNDDLY